MSECAVKARRTGVAAAPAIAVPPHLLWPCACACARRRLPAICRRAALSTPFPTRKPRRSRGRVSAMPAAPMAWRRDRLQRRQARYILRGQFRDGDLLRQENVRDCAGNVCADDVPRSLLRLHEQATWPCSVADWSGGRCAARGNADAVGGACCRWRLSRTDHG